MRYSEIPAKPPLDKFIECFWTLDGDGPEPDTPPERILPDGCVELILNAGERFLQHTDRGPTLQPRHFLVGQMTGPILISPTGRVELLGIRFHPGGTAPFLRMPMNEVTNQVTELGALSGDLERELSSISHDVTAVESALIRRLRRGTHESPAMQLASRIVDAAGLVSVDQLANDAGISNRQLERRFLREVGVGPKLLSRILRFQQVFRAVERFDAAWASIAVECGYYDQAHLIRDFRQFAQQTPSVLFAEQSALTESFTRKTRTSDFSNTAR